MTHHECSNCAASFTLEATDQETAELNISYCPYCGTEIIEELDFS